MRYSATSLHPTLATDVSRGSHHGDDHAPRSLGRRSPVPRPLRRCRAISAPNRRDDARARAVAAAADIPPEGIGNRIRHVSYSDIGGRPDSVQTMTNRGHLYVGHMFSDGVTVLDARDPRNLKPVHYFATPNTRTHHFQIAGDYLLLANGANLARAQSYDNSRDYFENTLADSVTKRDGPAPGFARGCRSSTSRRIPRSRARSHSSRCPASA